MANKPNPNSKYTIDFHFNNFFNTAQIAMTLDALDDLAAELRQNNYDYSSSQEHPFQIDGLLITVYTDEEGDVKKITTSIIENEEGPEVFQ